MAGYTLIFKCLVALCFLLEAYAATSDLYNPRYIGYFPNAGETTVTTETITIPRESEATYTTSGPFASVCKTSTSECPIMTKCNDGTLSGPGTGVLCDKTLSCVTMTIFQTSPAGTPSAKFFFCGLNWSANTVYRELAASTTEIKATSSTKVSTVSSTEMLSASVPPVPATSTSDLPPKGTSEPDLGSSSAISSKAWIAGPVLGGVVALALFVAGGFYWGRRSRRHDEPMNTLSVSYNTPQDKPSVPTQSASFPAGIPMTSETSPRETSMPSSAFMELSSDPETCQRSSQSPPQYPANPQGMHTSENRL